MADGLEDRFVTFREHSELKQEVMTLRAKLEALPDEVRELRRDIAALKDLVKSPGGTDHVVLAMHHIADKMTKNGTPLERIFALGGAIAMGALAVKFMGFGA